MEQIDSSSSSVLRNKQCVCAICEILRKGFSGYDFQEKRNIISSGRQTPLIGLEAKVDKSKKKFTRHFQLDFYDKSKWLTACSTFSKLYCWPCLLFNISEKTPWNSSGFSDLNNFHKNVRRHSLSKSHLTAVIKEKTFGITHIEHSLDNQSKLDIAHNKIVAKNRDIFKRLIDITCFLGERELCAKDRESTSRGNYIGLIDLLAKYDEPLNVHLKDSTVFQVTSNQIQNVLIKCVDDVILEYIKKEIKEASFVSIILDETTDITNCSQVAVIVRYVKSNGTVQERFLRFLDIITERTAETMYKIVCDIVEELECGLKLVAQSYDGAAVMANHLGDLQAKVKDKFQSATFVHCFAHRLNLVLSQGMELIKECKVFFSTLTGMADFFSRSSKRTRALNIRIQKGFSKIAPAQWDNGGRLVQTVSQNRAALIEFFGDILDTKDQWDPESVNAARGYIQLLENDLDFNFLLNVFSEIFSHTDLLFDILTTKSNDIGFCVQQIGVFEQKLNQKRNQFQYFWEKTININLEPQRKRIKVEDAGDMETSYLLLFLEIVDNIIQQLEVRFQNFNELKFVELCNFKSHNSKKFPEDALNSLKQTYGDFFDSAALYSQLNVLYDTPEVNNQETPFNMLLFLKGTGLDEQYSEVFTLCKLVLTIPATNPSMERSFSTLNRIKTFVKNFMGEERSSNLAVISIERECIKDLSQNPKFYEDVIDKFAKVDGTIQLHYK